MADTNGRAAYQGADDRDEIRAQANNVPQPSHMAIIFDRHFAFNKTHVC
jgi:hypothetical protein